MLIDKHYLLIADIKWGSIVGNLVTAAFVMTYLNPNELAMLRSFWRKVVGS